MFTGIIQAKSNAQIIKKTSTDLTLEVNLKDLNTNVKIGDSIAINGVCLTVVSIEQNVARFNLINETLDRTTFRDLQDNEEVNLEPSLTIDSKLDGHLVYGDVDSTGTIIDIKQVGDSSIYTFSYPKEFGKYFIDKGRITVDGASLTVIDSEVDGKFSIALIPHSKEKLTLGNKKVNDKVNLEYDVYAKIVFKQRRYNA